MTRCSTRSSATWTWSGCGWVDDSLNLGRSKQMTRYGALLVASLVFCTLTSSVAEPRPADWIRRLDGSRISIQEADSFARKTLEAAHVTGAQLAVLDGGRLVWSAAYGLRRREPKLPMDRETTTWAASITKGRGPRPA